MDWPHVLFLHRKNIHKLHLLYHPDKGGDSNIYIEFDTLRKKLQQWDKHWYKIVFSKTDVQAILNNNLSPEYQRNLKNQLKKWSQKLTLSMILNHIEMELTIVKNVWDIQRTKHTKWETEYWNSNNWFPNLVPNANAIFYGFSIHSLCEYLQQVKKDLVNLKLNLQSGDNCNHFYKPIYCDLDVSECLDANFNWLHMLHLKKNNISKWLLKPNKWSYLQVNCEARTPLEDYEFEKIKKKSHVCTVLCKWTEVNQRSSQLRLILDKKIKEDGLKVYKSVYHYLNSHHYSKWVPRSKIVTNLKTEFLPKFLRCELKKMCNYKSTFCEVNENSSGLLMKKTRGIIQFKVN